MNIEALRNLVHREALRVIYRFTRRTACVVDSYDGSTHRVKVKLQPEGTLSGWMQIEEPQDGEMHAPAIGDFGWVEFHEADRRAGTFVAAIHNNAKPPPKAIAAGEFYKQTDGGFSIYLKSDGSGTFTDKSGAVVKMDGAGNVGVTASVAVTLAAPAINLSNGGSLQQLVTAAVESALNNHIHLDSRGGNTTPPTVPIVTAGDLTSIVKAQ